MPSNGRRDLIRHLKVNCMSLGGPVGFHAAGLFHGPIDTCSCGLMFNDTVHSGQVCVNLSEELMPPPRSWCFGGRTVTIFRVEALTDGGDCMCLQNGKYTPGQTAR